MKEYGSNSSIKGAAGRISLIGESVTETKKEFANEVLSFMEKRDLLYTKSAALLREEIVFIIKSWIKSDVFVLLLRNILLLPDEFRLWTRPAVDEMLTVNVNSISAFQLCKEVYGNKAKSAPFTLSPVRV